MRLIFHFLIDFLEKAILRLGYKTSEQCRQNTWLYHEEEKE